MGTYIYDNGHFAYANGQKHITTPTPASPVGHPQEDGGRGDSLTTAVPSERTSHY